MALKDDFLVLVAAQELVPTLAEKLDLELAASEKVGFDKGVASVGQSGDVVYTQADLDAAVASEKENSAALSAKAVEDFKASFLAEYDAAQASESDLEAAVRAKLQG